MVGRPPKLNQELLEKAKTYLGTCIDSVQFNDKGGINYTNVNLPTIVGFALYLGINKDTVNEWCKEYVVKNPEVGFTTDHHTSELHYEFSVLVKEIIQEQEKRALNMSLGGLYNPKISALILGRYGYTEKTETDVTSKGEKINVPVSSDIEEIARRVGEELKLKKQQ